MANVADSLTPRLRSLVSSRHVKGLAKVTYTSSIVIGNLFEDEKEAASGLADFGFSESEASQLFHACVRICDGEVQGISRRGLSAASQTRSIDNAPHPLQSPLESVHVAVSGASVLDGRDHIKGKLLVTVALMWDLLVLAGDSSAIRREAQLLSHDLQQQLRAHVMSRWVDLPSQSLKGYLLSFHKFSEWCARYSVDPFKATRAHMILYFASLQDQKATVAQRHYRALLWLNAHLELNWSLAGNFVAQSAAARSSHIEQQVSPMRLSLWVVLTILSSVDNIVVRGLALFWILILEGVLRPVHLQRSSISVLLPEAVEGRATAGKARLFGKRRPFTRRCPRIDIIGGDLGERVVSFFALASDSERSFFLPDTRPDGSGLEAKTWATTPMPQGNIRRLTALALEKVGVPMAVSDQLKGFYSRAFGAEELPEHATALFRGASLRAGTFED